MEQVRLVLANLLRSELVGRLMKMLGEVTDDPDVGFCGTIRVITALSSSSIFWRSWVIETSFSVTQLI